jgi:eukaryotic-like serine/threonine-protein kinase
MNFLNQLKTGRQIQRLKTAGQDEVAVRAAKDELVRMGVPALEPVFECLSHGEARLHAMEVLDRLLSEATLGHYLEALRSPNPAVVSGVAQVLSKSSAYDPSRLVALLADPSFHKSVIESILWARVESIPARRLILLIPEVSKDARAVVFRLLEKVASADTVDDLVDLVSHEDWWVRQAVARLLGEFNEPNSKKSLMRLTKDSQKGVRLQAVESLHKLRDTMAVPALADRLRDDDLKVQTAAIDALVELGDASAVPHLLTVLKDESEYARRAAVEVLNQVANNEAIYDLVRALRDEDWWVRVRAADALGSLGGDKVVEGVIGLLKDPDDFLRRYGIEILNAVPSTKAVEHLILALNDADWWVRERAIDALAKTGDTRAVDPLLDLLRADVTAAPHCVRALGILGDVRVVEPLSRLVHSENPEIRREATNALVAFSRKVLPPAARTLVSQALGSVHPEATRTTGIPLEVRDQRGMGPEADRSSVSPATDHRRPEPMSASAASASPTASATPIPSDSARSPGSPGGKASKDAEEVNFLKLQRDTQLLGRYRVVRQIGKGGFGAIYLVHDSAIQEEIIFKILNPQLAMDEIALARFVQELKFTRGITHRNVIRLFDFLDLGGARAVSMEYFPSRDLGKIIRSEGALDTARALRILSQVCEGLTAAHEGGVVHRDVKPANILVGKDDTVKIVDFGLASVEQQIGTRLTKSGLLIGTPEYMSPEQISGGEVDHRADLYSLGIVMYETFSGKKPFTGETPVKVLFQHLEAEAPSLQTAAPNLPPAIYDLVRRAMSKEPGGRPQTAQEFWQAIEAIRAGLAEAA